MSCLRQSITLLAVLGFLALGTTSPSAQTYPGDNGLIAFDGFDRDIIRVIAADGTGEREVGQGIDPSWSPDGQLITFFGVFGNHGIFVVAPDGSGQRTVVEQADDNTFDAAPTFTPDGDIVFARSNFEDPSVSGLYRVEIDGSGLAQIISGDVYGPAVSPDGSTIAFSSFSETGSAIELVGIDGSNRRVLAAAPPAEPGSPETAYDAPSWSPDGTQLVFSETGQFGGPLHIIGADGQGARQLVAEGEAPSWSPDGTAVAFASGGSSALSIVNVDGTGQREIRPFSQESGGVSGVAWQPVVDGSAPPPPPSPGETPDLEVGDVTFDGDPATTERVDTPSPQAAALAIAQGRFATAHDAAGSSTPEFAQEQRLAAHVVLSRNDVFADSLAGAPLVGDGPIFFTDPEALTAETREAIDRVLQPGGRVYLLGGVGAVSQGIEDQLAAAGYEVVRLAGPSRVETSVRISQEVRSLYPGTRVAIARAGAPEGNPTAAWADSITGGAWAAFSKVPVLVTPSESLHPAVAEFLTADGPSESILLGGAAALSAEVEAAVPNPTRVAGPSRDETAVEIAQALWEQVASGERQYIVFNAFAEDGWMFGLAAAGVASDAGAPLLPANPAGASDSVLSEVAKTDPNGPPQVDLLVLGGDTVLPPEVVAELDAQD